MAFWWSLDRKGHRLQKTLHGGCPILKGSKWIFNKWVHYFDQWKKFPCGLKAESTFDPPLLHYWIKLTLRGKKLPSNPQCWILRKMIIIFYHCTCTIVNNLPFVSFQPKSLYISHAVSNFHGTEIEIWIGFGPIGIIKNNWAEYEQLLRAFFFVFS